MQVQIFNGGAFWTANLRNEVHSHFTLIKSEQTITMFLVYYHSLANGRYVSRGDAEQEPS